MGEDRARGFTSQLYRVVPMKKASSRDCRRYRFPAELEVNTLLVSLVQVVLRDCCSLDFRSGEDAQVASGKWICRVAEEDVCYTKVDVAG